MGFCLGSIVASRRIAVFRSKVNLRQQKKLRKTQAKAVRQLTAKQKRRLRGRPVSVKRVCHFSTFSKRPSALLQRRTRGALYRALEASEFEDEE